MLIGQQVSISVPASNPSSVNEGGRLTIICSSPLGGAIDWLHNNRPISVSTDRQRYTVTTVAIGNELHHTLNVSDVRVEDAGKYTCRQTFADERNINVTRIDRKYKICLMIISMLHSMI